MILKVILFCSYVLLQSAFKITSLIHPSFKKRLMERDLSFVVSSKTSPAAGQFKLKQGNLSYSNKIDGFVNFSMVWNGWGSVDTLRKIMRLNLIDFMSMGMLMIEGDMSSLDYLVALLGEMIGCYRKRKLTPLKRAQLKKEPS